MRPKYLLLAKFTTRDPCLCQRHLCSPRQSQEILRRGGSSEGKVLLKLLEIRWTLRDLPSEEEDVPEDWKLQCRVRYSFCILTPFLFYSRRYYLTIFVRAKVPC